MSVFVVFAERLIFKGINWQEKLSMSQGDPLRGDTSPAERLWVQRRDSEVEMASPWGQVHLNRPELASVGPALTSNPQTRAPTFSKETPTRSWPWLECCSLI